MLEEPLKACCFTLKERRAAQDKGCSGQDIITKGWCNSKLYVTTGRALASSYNLTRQAWLDLEELRRYLRCVKLVNL